MLVTVTLNFSVLLSINVNVKCSVLLTVLTLLCLVLLMVTVTLEYSVLLMVTHSAVFSVPNGHCHSAPYRRSAVVMNVPSPRTASHLNDAAGSHFCHFNKVLYSRSYSECQLPLNRSRRDTPGAVSSVQN